MTCLMGLMAMAFPRMAIILVVIFSDYIGTAYQTTIWPLLGFFFMPVTTLAYAWAMHSSGSVAGLQLFVVIIAVLIDVGTSATATVAALADRVTAVTTLTDEAARELFLRL